MNIIPENKMWRVVIPVSISILLLVNALFLLVEIKDEVSNAEKPITLSFSSSGEVFTVNDIARLSFIFSELDEDLNVARGEVERKADEAYTLLDESGVERADIKTTSYRVNPEYDYIYEKKGVLKEKKLKGYRVTHSTFIKIRDIDSAGDIISGITEIGPENVSSLSFDLEDDDRKYFEEQATILAIKNTKAKAKKIAKESKIRLGKVIDISINKPVFRTSRLYAETASLTADSFSQSSIPIEQGEDTITRHATITYEVKI